MLFAQTSWPDPPSPGTPPAQLSLDQLCVQSLEVDELDPARLASWQALEDRALEGNPFLSAHFVLPAARYLTPGRKPLLLFVVRRDVPEEVLAMAAFERHGPTARLPVPHLRAYRSQHSFLSGVLLDRRAPRLAAQALLWHLARRQRRWQVIEWIDRSADTPQARLLDEVAAACGMRWHEYGRSQRAALYPMRLKPHELEEAWGRRTHRNLKRRARRLEEHGPLRFHRLDSGPDARRALERFLSLEDMGWKGSAETSLLACPASHAFFWEMFEGFGQRGQGFFTALYLKDEPIAVSANLRSGQAGFAFKLGWDLRHRAAAPGVLLATEMARRLAEAPSSLEVMDSCAASGAFVERYWPHRRAVASGVYTLGPASAALIQGVRGLHKASLRLRQRLHS